jgi:type III secretion protein U
VSEKSEEATPRRLRKAREEGDSGASAFAAQAVAFVAVVAVLPSAARALVSRAGDDLRLAIAHAADAAPTTSIDGGAAAGEVVAIAAPVLLAAAIAGAAASVVQTGGFVATKRIAPDLRRLDVVGGLAQLVSRARLFAVARAMLGAVIVAYLAYRALRAHLTDIARLAAAPRFMGATAADIALDVAKGAAAAGLALGAIDLFVVRAGWAKRLRMTKEEVKREHKETEGDPEVKAARQRAHRDMLAAATIANVRNASVVVVNPTHLACALRYDEGEGDEAPVVVANGDGQLAERIVRAAHDYGVPVLRDVPLAQALHQLEVGDAIPEALYEAVAEILREAWEQAEAASRND